VLYFILKPFTNIFLRVFYHIQVKNPEHFPGDKPLVLAPNHVNAFIDPVVIGMLSKRKVRFFARGDVFKGRIARWFLNDMNISPMYRQSEGYGDVRKNDQTFQECRKLLEEHKAILLFPEGICIQERRIQKVKKGLARIILGAEEASGYKEDICILPIGLNYSAAPKMGSRLLLIYGEPVHVSYFHKQYIDDKVKAINSLTQAIEMEMRKLIVSLDNRDDDALYEGMKEIFVNQWMEEDGEAISDQIAEHEKNTLLAAQINQARVEMPDLLNKLRKENLAKISIGSTLNDFLIMWFSLPVYWVGMLLNGIPYRIARRMANKMAKNIEFHASVYANAGMFMWLLYYALQLVCVGLYFRNWSVLTAWAVVIPLTGYHTLRFYPRMKKIFGRWRLLGLVKKKRDDAARLINEREEIVQLIRKFMKSEI